MVGEQTTGLHSPCFVVKCVKDCLTVERGNILKCNCGIWKPIILQCN